MKPFEMEIEGGCKDIIHDDDTAEPLASLFGGAHLRIFKNWQLTILGMFTYYPKPRPASDLHSDPPGHERHLDDGIDGAMCLGFKVVGGIDVKLMLAGSHSIETVSVTGFKTCLFPLYILRLEEEAEFPTKSMS